MRTSRYAKSRQKACQNCAKSRLKCDRLPGTCTRCKDLRISCRYPGLSSYANAIPETTGSQTDQARTSIWLPQSPLELNESPFEPRPWIRNGEQPCRHNETSEQQSIESTVVTTSNYNNLNISPGSVARVPSNANLPDFTNLQLVCPIDASEIRNRWLNCFVPDDSQPAKVYPTNVSIFILRMLKAYVGTVVHGRGIPPFVHQSQLKATTANQPLITCLSLVRTCDTLLPGAHVTSANILQKEIENITQQSGSYTDVTLLSGYQACLIYSLVLQFWLPTESLDFIRQAVVYLQELACATSRDGLVCREEQHGARPRWEAWVIAETKRRTLYTMYLFDNVLSALDGLPTFLGIELHGLPAPANKILWQAQSRDEWERSYNAHLVAFPRGGLRIDELWPIPAQADEITRNARQRKTDSWLEDLDEFGTMLYAVTSITHGQHQYLPK